MAMKIREVKMQFSTLYVINNDNILREKGKEAIQYQKGDVEHLRKAE
jgi:hypothetical protein